MGGETAKMGNALVTCPSKICVMKNDTPQNWRKRGKREKYQLVLGRRISLRYWQGVVSSWVPCTPKLNVQNLAPPTGEHLNSLVRGIDTTAVPGYEAILSTTYITSRPLFPCGSASRRGEVGSLGV